MVVTSRGIAVALQHIADRDVDCCSYCEATCRFAVCRLFKSLKTSLRVAALQRWAQYFVGTNRNFTELNVNLF